MIKEINPVKKIFSYIMLGLGVLLALSLFFAFNWMANHLYTVIWFIAFVICLCWLIVSLVITTKEKIMNQVDDDSDIQLPSEKFEG